MGVHIFIQTLFISCFVQYLLGLVSHGTDLGSHSLRNRVWLHEKLWWMVTVVAKWQASGMWKRLTRSCCLYGCSMCPTAVPKVKIAAFRKWAVQLRTKKLDEVLVFRVRKHSLRELHTKEEDWRWWFYSGLQVLYYFTELVGMKIKNSSF